MSMSDPIADLLTRIRNAQTEKSVTRSNSFLIKFLSISYVLLSGLI